MRRGLKSRNYCCLYTNVYLTFAIAIQYSNIVNSDVAEVIESGCSNICPIIVQINSKCQCFYNLYTCTIILLKVVHIMSVCIEGDHHYIPYFLEISPQQDFISKHCLVRRQFEGGYSLRVGSTEIDTHARTPLQ